jgi:hypothetical protein
MLVRVAQMARSPRIPKYRRHSSGQARVTLAGKDHPPDPYGSAGSEEAYRRLIAEWLQGRAGRPDPCGRMSHPCR